MREFINLIESIAPPQWFLAGTIVNITDDRWDASEYLEGNEYDYEWRLCMVPREVAGVEDFKPIATYRETPEQRMAEIKAWAATRGGLDKALLERPPVVLWTSQGMDSLDGYHRTGLATQLGMERIPMLVGLGERDEED